MWSRVPHNVSKVIGIETLEYPGVQARRVLGNLPGSSVAVESPDTRVSTPTHVAITPDGNRRWARGKGLQPLAGHERGADVFKEMIRHASKRGVRHVSIWGMSLDNFVRRDLREVAGLLQLFRAQFRSLAEDADIHERGVHVNVLGRWREKFPFPVRRAVERAMDATKDYGNLFLNIFLAYSGTDEMLEAVRRIASEARKASRLTITPELIKKHLFTRDLPPVDLLIRTGGEPHLSAGFMMWDMADAQLYFTEKYWPDFSTDDFDDALAKYARRERRFGR